MREGVVTEIAGLAKEAAQHNFKPETKEILGRTHLFTPQGDGTFEEKVLGGPGVPPPPLFLHTLTGLIGYLQNRTPEAKAGEPTASPSAAVTRDGAILDQVLVHVSSHLQVNVLSPLDEAAGAYRTIFATAAFAPLIGSNGVEFAFGKYLDLETFNVGLQTLFEDSDERARILRVTGTVREEKVTTATDDGVSQKVVAQAGTVGLYEAAVPNPVTLRPFRTFREVDQPGSLFVVRLKKGAEGQLPTAALIEADGGKWKLDAIDAIAKFLRYKLPTGVTLLA